MHTRTCTRLSYFLFRYGALWFLSHHNIGCLAACSYPPELPFLIFLGYLPSITNLWAPAPRGTRGKTLACKMTSALPGTPLHRSSPPSYTGSHITWKPHLLLLAGQRTSCFSSACSSPVSPNPPLLWSLSQPLSLKIILSASVPLGSSVCLFIIALCSPTWATVCKTGVHFIRYLFLRT